MSFSAFVSASEALVALGWSSFFESQLDDPAQEVPDHEPLEPARVVVAHGARVGVLSAQGAADAVVGGRIHHDSASADLPVVGDWVGLRRNPHGPPHVVARVLARRTAFVRKAAGKRVVPQVVAANIDVALLVLALGADFNLRRLERYLAAALHSGATPVVVLGKADLCVDPGPFVACVGEVAPGVPVRVVSALRGDGLDELRALASPGVTMALLGSSGVGKSALVNRLLGADVQTVRAVRAHDERGRHTTTHRELFPLEGGGIILDTPGMRELEPWAASDDVAGFDDIGALAGACRFRDCRHEAEPGCRVLQAIEAGELRPERLASQRKLAREVERQRSRGEGRARPDPVARVEAKRRWREIARATRSSPKR